jgi:ubiquinone/menaquinone biosynthesis C-methylase UbiE
MNIVLLALYVLLGIIVFALLWLLVIVRGIRRIYKFPIPQFLTPFIDNPLRHKLQPHDKVADDLGLKPGMRVLEVGPGVGGYTIAAARRVGPTGKIISIDIEPKIIERLQARLQAEDVTNVEARVADVFALPFEDGSFDAIYMVTVIGEIPMPERAMKEFHRVLKPGGILGFSELFLDPDYPLPRTIRRWAESAGFKVREMVSGFLTYTLSFENRA